MFTDALALFAWHRVVNTTARGRNQTKIPEPEFVPFRLPEKDAMVTRAQETNPVDETREPMTLEELGVPRPLAHDIEAAFRSMGAIRGGRVKGFVFRTSDGTAHQLRVSNKTDQRKADLAA